jgi:hypothetical protein
MKFLTIRQPWASLIAVGAKQIETRPFSTKYRGPLAIHAGKAQPSRDLVRMGQWLTRWDYGEGRYVLSDGLGKWGALPLGAVVAVCDLIDVVPIHDTSTEPIPDDLIYTTVDGRGLYRQTVTGDSWVASNVQTQDLTDQLPLGVFDVGRFAWLLGNVRPIDPVPMKGAQGLRDLPADILERIR